MQFYVAVPKNLRSSIPIRITVALGERADRNAPFYDAD